MFDLIAIPLGWIMYALYQVIHDYGLTIILFTLLIKLAMFPTGYKQHISTLRMQSINPKLAKLKKSFSNNPERLAQEQNKLYQEEGINPMGSCLPSLITMFILMGVWQVVQKPITHILRLKDEAKQAQTMLSEWFGGAGKDILGADAIKDAQKLLETRPELTIIEYSKTNPEIFSGIEGFTDTVNAFDNSVLGLIDLGAVPSIRPDGGWTKEAIALAMIPILSGVLQLILTIYTQYKSKKNNPDAPSMGGMTAMLYFMPLFSIWMAFSLPAGVGFYWVWSSLFSLLQTIGLNLFFTQKRTEKVIAKEREKSKKKKPGFYQRMMEQQQAMLDEQNGKGGSRAVMQRTGANRVSYADEDGEESLSRSEMQEYNRQRINEARKRMAEKYGDE